MESILKTLFPCLPLRPAEGSIQLPSEKQPYRSLSYQSFAETLTVSNEKPTLTIEEAAESIVSTLLSASKAGSSLDAEIQSLVHRAGGWSQYLATKILTAVEAVLKAGKKMSAPMQQAYDKACEQAKELEVWASDHPLAVEVLCTVIALGVLVVLTPYVVEYLGFCFGFGELGPIEGKPLIPCDYK